MRRLWLVAAIAILAAAPVRADHLESHIGPGEPQRDFPADFMPLLPHDAQARATTTTRAWTDPRVGGWGGGACPEDRTPRAPVVFVHGTSVDASFWRAAETSDGTIVNVRDRFLAAGWCANELWAVSYTGAPGYFTYNDVNAGEVYAFIEAVRAYTGADRVHVVAHSLGVTVVRKAAFLHDDLLDHMATFVAIAGANHGTTTCRGLGTIRFSHVCEEVEPGSAWLAELNGDDETPPGPRYLTIYDGSGLADQFYVGPDAKSPALAGACNHEMPFVAHNTLARGAAAVATFAAFIAGGPCPAGAA